MGASHSTNNNNETSKPVEIVIECLDGVRCAVRMPATTTMGQLRHVLAAQLDPETMLDRYVFVRSSDNIRIARNQEACLTIGDLGGGGGGAEQGSNSKPMVRLHPVEAAGVVVGAKRTAAAAAAAAAAADIMGENEEQQQHIPKGSPPPPKKSRTEFASDDGDEKDTKQEEDAAMADLSEQVALTSTTTCDTLEKEGADEKDATMTTTPSSTNTFTPCNTTTTLGNGTTIYEPVVEGKDPASAAAAAVEDETTNYVFVTPAPNSNHAAAMNQKNESLLVDTDVGISDTLSLMAYGSSLSSRTKGDADATIPQGEIHQQEAETTSTKHAVLMDDDGADSNAKAKATNEEIDSVDATKPSADPRDATTLNDDPRIDADAVENSAATAEKANPASHTESTFYDKLMEEKEDDESVTDPKLPPPSSAREGSPALESASAFTSNTPNLETLLAATDALFEQAAAKSNITVTGIFSTLNAQFGCLLNDSQKTAVNERFVQLVATTKQSLDESSSLTTERSMKANDDEHETNAAKENNADDMAEQVNAPGNDRQLAAATSPRLRDSLEDQIVDDNAMEVDGPEREENEERDTEILVHAKFMNYPGNRPTDEDRLRAVAQLLRKLNLGNDAKGLRPKPGSRNMFAVDSVTRTKNRSLYDAALKRIYFEDHPHHDYGFVRVVAILGYEVGQPDAACYVRIPVATFDIVWNNSTNGSVGCMDLKMIGHEAPYPSLEKGRSATQLS